MSTSTSTLTAMSLKMLPQVQEDPGLEELERCFEIMAGKPTVQHIAAISTENNRLRAENVQLKNDEQVTIRKIGQISYDRDQDRNKLQDTVEKLNDATKKTQDLAAKLYDANKKLGDNDKKLNHVQVEMESRVQSVKKELEEERKELQRLLAFSVELVPIAQNAKEITSKLDSIWSSALTLAETWFGGDLSQDILDKFKTSAGSSLGEHKAVSKIPLPLSNTATAKQMRTAAFLAVLGYELRQHLLRPTYLLRDSHELDKVLEGLGEIDADAESHLRSVLLAVISRTKGSARPYLVEVVKRNIQHCFDDLVPKEQREMFRSEVDKFCKKTSQQWEFIQKLDARVEIDLDVDEKDTSTWKSLTLRSVPETKGTVTTTPAAAGPSQSNKTARVSGAPAPPSPNNKKGATATASQLSVDTAEAIVKPVMIWPSFYGYSDDVPTFSCGYLLTASQVFVAMLEDKGVEVGTGQHRAMRQKKRTSSISVGSPTGSGGQAGHGSFLSAQAGGGQRGS